MSSGLEVIDPSLPARQCQALRNGVPCRAAPLRDSTFCFWHDPATSDEAMEARRLGGLRRPWQRIVADSYDLAPLGTVDDIRRLLEMAALDAAALENSIARARSLAGIAGTAASLLEIEALLKIGSDGEPRLG